VTRPFETSIETLKSLAEPTRLRLLALLRHGDLSVKDLTSLLGQSQPRLSRHLKLLSDAGWIVRFPEGAWVYYRIAEDAELRAVWEAVFALVGLDNDVLRDDAERLTRLKAEQSAHAQAFFQAHAARWDALRADLVPDGDVESAIVQALGTARVERLLDVGTGTGRMLVLLRDLYVSAIGIDPTHAMLQVARATLAEHAIDHAQVRHGDGMALGLPRDSQDLVTLHQVMHFFDDPRPLLAEARRVLAPSGRLLIVDFAPHTALRRCAANIGIAGLALTARKSVAGWKRLICVSMSPFSSTTRPPTLDRPYRSISGLPTTRGCLSIRRPLPPLPLLPEDI
jgi:ubiquinone/menaquinone biosynthesis C-methylase UbiE/DNA-binding transcriptional ArsR family regulator